jgi:tRNA pseudouridine13 synthase
MMAVETLPFITADLPGCGGQIKAQPDHFVVEEVPLYDATGEGPHLYVCLTREGWTTRQVLDALARLLGVPARDIGYAGLKDRHARCTQVFSLPGLDPSATQRIEDELPFQVVWARRHRNKLKPGHLLGNRFHITVSDLDVAATTADTRAGRIAAALAQHGLPNFFGPQRFGHDGANIARGYDVLTGSWERDKWLRRLVISAYQSHLFNRYLARRIALGWFDHLVAGDVAKKTDTGGMFDVQEVAAEQGRYARGEITFTGPMFGAKMWAAKATAGELEASILAETGLTLDNFAQARVEGTRRPGRLPLTTIDYSVRDDQLQLVFFLPKGAYATVVVREFTKQAAATDELEMAQEDL